MTHLPAAAYRPCSAVSNKLGGPYEYLKKIFTITYLYLHNSSEVKNISRLGYPAKYNHSLIRFSFYFVDKMP